MCVCLDELIHNSIPIELCIIKDGNKTAHLSLTVNVPTMLSNVFKINIQSFIMLDSYCETSIQRFGWGLHPLHWKIIELGFILLELWRKCEQYMG